MAELSDYAENKLLDHILGTTSYTAPTTVYIALYTTNPTDADTGTEVSGNGYAREAVTFAASSGGSAASTGALSFTASGGDWGTITHVGIRDALTGGNLLYHSPLDTARSVPDGATLTFAIGDIVATLA